jgi:hypothetical protein
VQNLKRSEALISQELRRITNEKQAAQSEKEQDNGIQRKEMPPKRSISPDFIFESMALLRFCGLVGLVVWAGGM